MLTSTVPLIPLLVLAIISFSASCYVIISHLIPFLPPHPLSRRLPRTAFGLTRRRLTPAKKATLYIAVCDILALAAFLWQAIVESLGDVSVDVERDVGASARLWVALTTRQTTLFIIAALTLLYVRSGKSLTFGKSWFPFVSRISASCSSFSAFKHLLMCPSFPWRPYRP